MYEEDEEGGGLYAYGDWLDNYKVGRRHKRNTNKYSSTGLPSSSNEYVDDEYWSDVTSSYDEYSSSDDEEEERKALEEKRKEGSEDEDVIDSGVLKMPPIRSNHGTTAKTFSLSLSFLLFSFFRFLSLSSFFD